VLEVLNLIRSNSNLAAAAFTGICFVLLLSLRTVQQNDYQRSVKDFGATGDGTGDDRAAIQATIDDVAAHGGGIVYFPSGNYRITIYAPAPGQFPWPRGLTIRHNIRLQGVDAKSSVIRLADNQVPYGALFAPEPLDSDVSDFGMYDLQVDLNALNNPLPTAAEMNQHHAWEDRRDRNTVFIHQGRRLRFERCRFSNFIGVWCLNLYSYQVSDVSIAGNMFDRVGGGDLDFDSSTVDTAGHRCRVTNNSFCSRNYNTLGGPLTYGLRTAIEVHNVDALVANNRIYGFPIGINLGGNSQRGNRSHLASGNFIKDAYNGIVVWSYTPDDGSSVGMQSCSIRQNTIVLNVDAWQAYGGKDSHCHGISIAQTGNSDAEIWDLDITSNQISYTHYGGTRDSLIDAYSSGICYDRWNWQGNTIGVRSGRLRFLNNTIDHPMGNGFYFRANVRGMQISGNIIIDPAAGAGSFWEGWKAALFFVGPESDLEVSKNRFVDDRAARKIPYGIYAANNNHGYCIARDNLLVDGDSHELTTPLLERDSKVGNWTVIPGRRSNHPSLSRKSTETVAPPRPTSVSDYP
jgi:Pectate lyase superfamily protein